MPRKGRPKSGYKSVAYPFRLSTLHEPQEKAQFDAWVEQTNIPERSVAIATVVKWLIREVSGITEYKESRVVNLQDIAAEIEQRVSERLRVEIRQWVETLVTDGAKFEVIQQARATVQNGDDFDDDILDNILEDFDGRQG